MVWSLDELIRRSLQQAAEETDRSDEEKVNMLLHVLTAFLRAQIEDGDERKEN